MNCVPTKTNSVWLVMLAPLPEFGEGSGWGRNLTFFITLQVRAYKSIFDDLLETALKEIV